MRFGLPTLQRTMEHPARPDILEAIGEIYETAFSVTRWSRVMDRVADLSGGNGALLIVRDDSPDDLQITANSTRYKIPHIQQYIDSLKDGEELRWVQRLESLPARTILRDVDVWPDRDTYDDMPTVKFLKHMDLYNRCAARLCDHGGWDDHVAILYPDHRGGMTEAEESTFHKLLPHLARAIEVHRPFVMLQRRFSTVLNVLDRLGIGVIILTDRAEVIVKNQEAARIIDASDPIGVDRKRTLNVCSEDQGVIRQEIFSQAQQARNPDKDSGVSLQLKRPSGQDPYAIDIVPFHDANALGDDIYGALMLVVDPDFRAAVSIDGLARSYQLTAAERSVCHLIAEGMTTPEIADDRNVSVGTVKTQTSAIFDKTQTRNRSELIRRALTIVPPLMNDAGQRIN